MNPNSPAFPVATYDDVVRMLAAVKDLLQRSAAFVNAYGSEPIPDSQAIRERQDFPKPPLVKDVHSRGLQSMETAADHLWAFHGAVTEPATTIAPWTITRGLLESAALACWFLDPQIDAFTRVGRCFAFRYKGFDEQIKIARAMRLPENIEAVQRRMTKVEGQAKSLGYEHWSAPKANQAGGSMHIPSSIELINVTLGLEVAYRLLSAPAHGHHWATSQIGYRKSEAQASGDPDLHVMERYLPPEVPLYAASVGITAFAKANWYLARLYGWHVAHFEQLLERIYDGLRFIAPERFWRSPTRRGRLL